MWPPLNWWPILGGVRWGAFGPCVKAEAGQNPRLATGEGHLCAVGSCVSNGRNPKAVRLGALSAGQAGAMKRRRTATGGVGAEASSQPLIANYSKAENAPTLRVRARPVRARTR